MWLVICFLILCCLLYLFSLLCSISLSLFFCFPLVFYACFVISYFSDRRINREISIKYPRSLLCLIFLAVDFVLVFYLPAVFYDNKIILLVHLILLLTNLLSIIVVGSIEKRIHNSLTFQNEAIAVKNGYITRLKTIMLNAEEATERQALNEICALLQATPSKQFSSGCDPQVARLITSIENKDSSPALVLEQLKNYLKN